MNDLKFQSGKAEQELPEYVRPQFKIMKDDEVLKAFQMTALEISAAGCWWMADGGSA